VLQGQQTCVASSEGARDIDRRIVLNLIPRRQPISRADLARVSGLQRSTISLIVEPLVHDAWVLEGPNGRRPRGRRPRGRRPTFLRLNGERVIAGVELRPSQTVLAKPPGSAVPAVIPHMSAAWSGCAAQSRWRFRTTSALLERTP